MAETAKPAVLDEQKLSAASELTITDGGGNKVKFGDIFESDKTIVVFIRHFFCGMCQDYVAQLADVKAEALAQVNTKLVVIGCGEWQLIKNYCKETGFSGVIYADASRSLYRALGMTIENLASTPSGEQKRSYVGGTVPNVFRSIWRGPIKNPQHIGKQGNISQLGGDFVLGPGKTCSFAHVMQHTQDHIEVAELMQAAGVQYP